jgi:hypothetical protein
MTTEPLEIFYSYADIDAPLRDKLITHLAILHQQDIMGLHPLGGNGGNLMRQLPCIKCADAG